MVAADYATLCRHISGFDRFGYEQFVRVFFAVTSRLFGLTINDQTVHALVPAADLLNHRHPPDVTWASDEAGEAFVMRATGAIAPGQAFHADYGNKCNSRLLLNHGFCLADNKNNTTEIDLPDAARDHPLAGLAWLYGYPGFDGTRRFRVPPSYAAWTTRQMFSFLRLSCAAGEDVQRMLRLGPDRPEIGPVSRKNETAVLLTLADACHAALASFPDALGDDLILLGSTDLPANARTCILMRSGEKQVLRAYLDLAEHGIQRLQSHPLSAAEPPATLSGFADYLDAIGKSLGSSTINPS
jgi:histone-lysine N-methyltransferase SETD3